MPHLVRILVAWFGVSFGLFGVWCVVCYGRPLWLRLRATNKARMTNDEVLERLFARAEETQRKQRVAQLESAGAVN